MIASSERMTNFLDESFFTWNSLVSVPKISKEYTSKHFGQIFSFLRNFSMSKTVISCDWRVTNFLGKSAFTLNYLESAAKGFAEFNPNHWQTFSFLVNFQFFLRILVRAKLLLFMVERSVRTGSNELSFLWKDDQLLRGKRLYLKTSGIGCKKFQRVHPEKS